MASVKSSSSRSRAAPAKGGAKDSANKLEENLNVFKSDNFDADAYVHSKCDSLNEKVPPLSSLLHFFLTIIIPPYFCNLDNYYLIIFLNNMFYRSVIFLFRLWLDHGSVFSLCFCYTNFGGVSNTTSSLYY